jgi:hypothetical protein
MAAARRTFAALLLSVAAACAAERDMPAASMHDLPPLNLVEELRVGSLDDPDEGFTTIGDVRVTEGDTVWVSEWSAVEIRVYAPDGRFVRRIGGPGKGPGELAGVQIWGLHGDTVWVVDDVRATYYRRDGSLISTVPLGRERIPVPPHVAEIMPVGLGSDGRPVGEPRAANVSSDPAAPTVEVELPLVVYGDDGGFADTTGYRTVRFEADRRRRVNLGRVEIREEVHPQDLPFQGRVGSDVLRVLREVPESADEGVVTVLRIRDGRDTLYRTEIAYTPVPLPASYRSDLIDARTESLREFAPEAALRAAMADLFTFRRFEPPVVAAAFTADGSVWLRPGGEAAEGWRWIVLAPDGALLGEAITPARTRPMWSDGQVLWAVERDDLGVPWLVRYRMD